MHGIRPPNWACDPPAKVHNLTLAQYQFGPVSDVVPREQLGMGYFIGDPSWEVAATTIPYEMLTATGNVGHLAASYDGPQALLQWFNALGQANASTHGLIDWSYLGDWVPVGGSGSDNSNPNTPNNKLVANANYALAAQQAAEMAAALGKAGDAALYTALAAQLSRAIADTYWNASALHWDRGSQSAQALCLAGGLGGQGLAAPAAAALLAGLQAAGGRLTVGASGAQVLLRVLHAIDPAAALALALQTAEPSWGAFVTQNSSAAPVSTPGTMWESWEFGDVVGGSSLNHIFKAGGISPYLYESALGLHFAMRPRAGREACPCEGSLGLPWSPSARLGMDCAAVAAVCSVVAGGAGSELGALRSAVERALKTAEAALNSSPGLAARVGFAVSQAAAEGLGRAQGWRSTPAGRVELAWAWEGGRLSVNVSAPAGEGAVSVLELPLGLGGEGGKRVSWLGGSVQVAAAKGKLGVVELTGSALAWLPQVLQCGVGAAAAHVNGGSPVPPAACHAVLTLTVPAGAHALLFETRA